MRSILLAGAALAALTATSAVAAATGTLTRSWQYPDTTTSLEVDNLIGDVRIERAQAGGFAVSVAVTTEAATQADADALAAAVEFLAPTTARAKFQVLLPEARFPRIYWREAPTGWFAGRTYVDYLDQRRRLVGDPEEGARVRVDIVIKAPADSKLEVSNVFGDVVAAGFIGDLEIEGKRGSLRAIACSGQVELDTGSGAVEVEGHNGKILADTGAGNVRVRSSEGSLDVDTGSGNVTVEGFSGSVRADTGSGGVDIRRLAGAGELKVDTGSGGVRIDGDLSSVKRLDIDTGSGGVRIDAAAWPSMTLVVDTGSGGIQADIPGVESRGDDPGRRVLKIGDGSGAGLIDTGSGSVILRTVTVTQ